MSESSADSLRSTGYPKPEGSSSALPWLKYEEDASGALSGDATLAIKIESDTDSDHPGDPDEDGAERDKAADPEVDREEPIDDEEELPTASLFVKRLKPQVLDLGPDMAVHPEPALVETQSLASVIPPPITYRLRIWDKMVAERRSGVLSGLQLEAIAYACQSHEQMLADGETRAGFALGDGTGAGKSRVLSGLIWENYLHGREKALWFTASPFLAVSIRKDFAAVGVDQYMAVHSLGDFKKNDVLPSESTLLIVSYGQLRGKGRYEQLMRWLGKDFDGLAAFDESHKAKNSIAITSKLVKQFQVELPQARVVYCSATIATEMTHLEYMPRLGLWGAGTNFAQWQDFKKPMAKTGLAAMELVAMTLKRQGRYLTRTLGFYDVEFSLLYASLDPVLAKAYDDSCTLWASLVLHLDELPKQTRTLFWGTHQRFFKSLFVAAKVPCVLEHARQALRDGHSVVIGLQGTNEAQTKQSAADPDNKRQKQPAKPTAVKRELQDDEDDLDLLNDGAFTEPARQILISMLQKHWGGLPEVRDEALRDLDAIEGLPGNPLDALIQGLGGRYAVAELTGRSVQWGQGPDGTWEYLPKANDADAHEVERRAFMDGRKMVAIVSEAASVGISLHADKDVINQRKRVHFVIELAWQADRALQQLGRTHRANQVCPPRYHLVVLDRPTAEVRFACSVARRLVSLGAIHHSDKHANMASMDLKEFNIETRYAHKAMAPLLSEIRSSEADATLLEHLHGTELYACLPTLSVPRFLNRLLGIPLDWQTEVIRRFVRGLQANVRAAKMKGNFQEGIIRLNATSITRNGPDLTVEVEGGSLALVPLLVDRGMTWETALEELSAAQAGDGTHHRANGFYLPSDGRGNVFLLIRQPSADETRVVFKKLSPNLGRSAGYLTSAEVRRLQHTRVGPGSIQAKQQWEALHEETGRPCTYGGRVSEKVLITGDLINLWASIQRCHLGRSKFVRVEVTSEDGLEAHVGICLDNSVAHVKQRFDAMRHQDELVKAYRTLQMEAALKRQQADEGQIKSPPSLFRAAARDFQATRPIDAKAKWRVEASAGRMEIVIVDSDDSDGDDSRPGPSSKRHWAAEERKPSGDGGASAAVGYQTPVNHKKARVDSCEGMDASSGGGSRAEADDPNWLEEVLALASCIETKDHMGGPWTEREIDILRQCAFEEDLRVKAAYNAARTAATHRGTPMHILDHFERSARALVKVIMASGGGRVG